MKYLRLLLIGIILFVIIAILVRRAYLYHAPPQYSGSRKIIGLQDTVEVLTDTFGMPYVFSKNNNDLFFTAGYLMARERLFQLTLLSAILNSNLSVLLGDEYSDLDNYLETHKDLLNFKDTVTLSNRNLDLIEAYCNGINVYAEETSRDLPISFKITKSKPLKWEPLDVINVIELMNNNSNNEGAILPAIRQYFGDERYLELSANNETKNDVGELLSFEDARMQARLFKLIGSAGSYVGPSAKVIFPEGEAAQRPYVIFDDIWDYQQPTKWFNMYLNSNNYDVEGSFVTGFPLPIVGKTNHSVFAWSEEVQDDINTLFELARGLPVTVADKVDNESFFYADTSGSIHGRLSNVSHLDIIKKSDDVVKTSETHIDSQKIANIQFLSKMFLNENSFNQALSRLVDWDGDESAKSNTALLVNTIYKHLIAGIFKDEMSLIDEDMYGLFINNTIFVENSLKEVLNNPDSAWLDDINTIDFRENLKDIAGIAIKKAIAELKNKYGTLFFQWGNVEPPIFTHVLASINAGRGSKNFNVGPTQRYMSSFNEIIYDEDLTPKSTLVLRKIYDLNDLNTVYSILPTGQSGLPDSPHYADQLEMYLKNELRSVKINVDTIRENNKYHKLILYPSG